MIATAVSRAANTVSRIKGHLSLEGICMEKLVVFGLGFSEGGWIRMRLDMGGLFVGTKMDQNEGKGQHG
jgi:hypothetical protein